MFQEAVAGLMMNRKGRSQWRLGGEGSQVKYISRETERSLRFIPRLPIIFSKDRKEPAYREDTCQPVWYERSRYLSRLYRWCRMIPVKTVTEKKAQK